MGALGNQQQERCHRGHKLEAPNTKACQNGGRRCRACECALSKAHNWKVRRGVFFTEEDVQEAADAKYQELGMVL